MNRAYAQLLNPVMLVLEYFGFATARARFFDDTLAFLAKIRRNLLAALKRQASPQGVSPNISSADILSLRKQIELAQDLIARQAWFVSPDSYGFNSDFAEMQQALRDDPKNAISLLDIVALRLAIKRSETTAIRASIVSDGFFPAADAAATPAGAVMSDAETKIAPVASGPSPSEGKPDSDALLWSVSTRLYESWPVKLVGLALVTAVALAGGGSLLIGGKALEVRKDLEDRAATAFRELDQQKSEVARRLTSTKEEIEQLKNVATQARKDAINAAKDEIKNNVDAISDELKRAGNTQLDQTIKILKKFEDNASIEIANLERAQKRLQELQDIPGNLERLKTTADQTPRLKSVADEALLSINKSKAEAESTSGQVKSQLAAIERQLGEQLRSLLSSEGVLGGIKERQNALIQGMDKLGLDKDFTLQILADAQKAKTRLDTLDGRNTALENRLHKLEACGDACLLPPSSPKPPDVGILQEKDLDRDKWRAIQIALRSRGTYAGKIDGKVGRGTRDAIKEFQRKDGATSDGVLTSGQIGKLLKPPEKTTSVSQ